MPIFDRVGSWCKDNLFACIIGAFVLGFFITLYILRNRLDDTTEIVITGAEDPAADSNTTASDLEVIVDLSGAVNKPGVYTLSQGSRVGDLLRMGEGLSTKAAAVWVAQNLNLSLPLNDAQKVYIPFVWDVSYADSYELKPLVFAEKGASSSGDTLAPKEKPSDTTAMPDTLIDVNTASSEALDALSGIGPAYADKIISGRPYVDFQDLLERSGVGKSTLTKIQNLITF